MRILVLLTCFNRKNKTVHCIKSLSGQKGIHTDFIVVDDKSTDGTAEVLKKYDNVFVLEGNGRLYYSGGMRLAIEAAKNKLDEIYDYVLLVNDDVDFYPHSIERLIGYLDGEHAIMVGATESGGALTYGGVVKTSCFKPSYKKVMSSDAERRTCDTFNANCVLIPWNIFAELDNIDPVYMHAMGDYDYGLEARRKGLVIYVSDFFVGRCDLNKNDNTWSDRKLDRLERIRLKESPKGLPFRQWFYYLHKNFGILTAIVYSFTPYMKILLRR